VLRTHLVERYGEGFLPANSTIQDWGITYDELEPYYDRFEYLAGISGKAGNLKGQIQEGGNPFEGPRSREYPTPPMRMAHSQQLFEKAAKSIGLHPFPLPSANLSQAYTNPYGVRLGPCTYCGFCERFGCANYSKASPQTCVLPALVRMPTFEARTNCEVTKINLTPDGKHATGVTYVDTQGTEWEQPAELVLLCAYALFNVRLLLLSGIGKPYDYQRGVGVVGRNYCYQTNASCTLFFEDQRINPFVGAGSLGMTADDYNGDVFDHGQHGFIGGANMNCNTYNGRPITYRPVPPGTPRWGSAWKRATAENYNRAIALGTQGSSYAYRDCYLDLDPTYKDRLGRPLMRLTFDYKENELKMSRFVVDRLAEIGKVMGAKQIVRNQRSAPWSVVPYQTTHNTGGAVIGSDPATSVVNRYAQCWDVPNVFVTGACLFPQNAGYNPTGTVGALTYWTADAIRDRYLRNSGQPLVRP